jgi:drug/metabolite transporter (DMT)-like permease
MILRPLFQWRPTGGGGCHRMRYCIDCIFIISFSGTTMHLNPIGDILSVGAAMVWSFYAVLSKKMGAFGYSVIQTTRRTFFYGILFMIPALYFFDFKWDL